MATVTPNFNWPVPTSTDLVKDGATAIEALGDSIDASLVDLKGGTTGQVLSKTSGTDMDFTWVTSDDANAIQNTIVDAKGDLIAASAADTPARLAVGSNGETLVADSSTSTGLRYRADYAAGKNKIINGDFGVWQRGTSFTPSAAWNYNADRFAMYCAGSGHTPVVSRQTFTPGTAPVAGYEGLYFWRYSQAAAGSGNTTNNVAQRIENVQTFAGQQVTVSFWGKADASRTVTSEFYQEFGSGGSAGVTTSIGSHSFTTSWQRFTATVTVPSISGKTVGTNSYLTLQFILPTGVAQTIDIWGVQVEAGSVATAFQTATGTIQGELAACQRYYIRTTGGSSTGNSMGFQSQATTTTIVDFMIAPQVSMRTAPTSVDYSNIGVYRYANATNYTGGTVTLYLSSNITNTIVARYTHGSAIFTINDGVAMNTGSNAATFIGFSAEL